MNVRGVDWLLACVLLIACASCSGQSSNAGTSTKGLTTSNTPIGTGEPGGTADDARLALLNPDEYAWKLFLYISRQAKAGVAGQPDESKPTIKNYDPDAPVVWETWAQASGAVLTNSGTLKANLSEVFKTPATQPIAWDYLNRSPHALKILSPDTKRLVLALSDLSKARGTTRFHVFIAPIGESPDDEEVRMNRSTYETIRANGLYSTEGIDAAVLKAKETGASSIVAFDPTSKEVKAQWVHLDVCDKNPNCTEKARYHWRTVDVNGSKQIYGLAALHILTKDLPNWFWADFAQIDCLHPVDPCKSYEVQPPENQPQDSTTRGPNGGPGPSGTNGVRNDTLNSKWQNYVLMGTETSFTAPDGQPNILSNPVIESNFQQSSCMTCHAYATAGLPSQVPPDGSSLANAVGDKGVPNIRSRSKDIGTPDCRRFFTPKGETTDACPVKSKTPPLYYQTDFVWSIPFRAFSKSASPPGGR